MMQHLVTSPRGARKSRKRVGRGDSAGQGSTAGRGMKGQKSRSGRGVPPGFEGGQLRLIKGLPMKRGFNNRFKTYYSLVKLDVLEKFEAGQRITPEILRDRGYLRDRTRPVKVLGDGVITKGVTVAAHKFTQSAREKITAAGGVVEEL
jgi:large subunit ribosomal protein L15